jgi:hypothetical protein
MLRTLLKLQCVHIRPPCTFNVCPTAAPRIVSQHRRNQTRTPAARLQLASLFSVFCKLPAIQELHKASKEMDVTGHYIKTVQKVDHVLQICPNQSQVLLAIGGPVISISLDPLTSNWLKSNLRQTPTCSKLSPPCYRHLTTISSMLGNMPRYHSSDQ